MKFRYSRVNNQLPFLKCVPNKELWDSIKSSELPSGMPDLEACSATSQYFNSGILCGPCGLWCSHLHQGYDSSARVITD